MTPEATVLGRVIQGARKARKLSQETLAFESGVNRSYISHIERGLQQPTVETLYKIAHALGISAADLLGQVESIVSIQDAVTPKEDGVSPDGASASRLTERLKEWEHEYWDFITAGDYEAAVTYFRLKLLEVHLLGVKEGLKKQMKS